MNLAQKLQAMTKTVIVLTLTAASMQASVIYNFAGIGLPGTDNEPLAFHLTVPNFINPGSGLVSFTCAQADSNTNCDPTVPALIFSIASVNTGFTANLQFDATNNTGYVFDFATGAFATPGVYTSQPGRTNTGMLTVTQTQTPEPTTLLLFAFGGFCLLARQAVAKAAKSRMLN
jgi:hypothetical protein